MKNLFFLIVFLAVISIAQKTVHSQDDPVKWKFFKIYVTTADDSIFTKLQDDMGVSPYLVSYTIYVDVRSEDPKKQFLVLGVIDDPSSVKFSWSQFREEVKKGLINWSKKNKMKAED